MNSQEHSKTKFGVRVICSEGDETFGKFVKSDCDGCLATDGCEDIGRNMMVVVLLFSTVLDCCWQVRTWW